MASTSSEFISRIMPNFGGGSFVNLIISIVLGTVGLALAGGFTYYMIKRKKNWNLKVEFKLPRGIKKVTDEDGNEKVIGTLKKEWGKGSYDGNKGVVYVKRKRMKPIAMKPFNIKEFLSDNNILTVLQVGVEDYRPVLEDSYIEVEDYETGEQGALIKAKIDTSESKTWKNSYERERKSTYTIMGFLSEHGDKLAYGFILLVIFVGFAIVIQRLPT